MFDKKRLTDQTLTPNAAQNADAKFKSDQLNTPGYNLQREIYRLFKEDAVFF